MTARELGTMDADRRRALLETAAREFASAGYERASLNRIIRARRMSKSSFYHYFDSKEALFDTVVREAATALKRDLEIPDPAQLAGPDFWDQIARLGQQLLALTGQQAWYVDFGKLFYRPDAPAGSSRELQSMLDHITAWLAAALAVGREWGAVRDDLPVSLQTELTLAVLSTMDRWSLDQLDQLDQLDASAIENLSRLQIDVIQRLLAPGEDAVRAGPGTPPEIVIRPAGTATTRGKVSEAPQPGQR